jgi:hypothetical protein
LGVRGRGCGSSGSFGLFASAFNETDEDEEGETVYGYNYKLTQSEEQEAVKSLKDIMDGKDVKVYDHCSMFIDVSYIT